MHLQTQQLLRSSATSEPVQRPGAESLAGPQKEATLQTSDLRFLISNLRDGFMLSGLCPPVCGTDLGKPQPANAQGRSSEKSYRVVFPVNLPPWALTTAVWDFCREAGHKVHSVSGLWSCCKSSHIISEQIPTDSRHGDN